MNSFDFNVVFKVYFLSLLWQFASWPFLKQYFKSLDDKGWVIGRISTTLLISLITWQLAIFGFRVNNTNFLFLILFLILLIDFLFIFASKQKIGFSFSKSSLLIFIEEILFILGLGFMVYARGFAPEIHSLEKFMDFGFVYQYLNSPSLPTSDMWFAGSSINYYSFGHYWASVIIRLLWVTPAVGYNIVLAIIMGLALMTTFSIVVNNIDSGLYRKIVGGLIGSTMVVFGGNSHALWYFLSHKLSMTGYWYADATRFIYNTIHEFPSYSFVVSDLHGHLLDLPIVLTFLLIFFHWTKNRGILDEILMGVFFGVMAMTNTWDVPIYAMLVGVYCLFELFARKTLLLEIIKTFFVILLSGICIAIPWWLGFIPISSGIGLVTLRSPISQILVLWGGGLISLFIASVSAKLNINKHYVRALALCSLLLIVIPELIYAKDIYPNHPRANTMFKLTYQSYIIMGILLGIGVGQLMKMERGLVKLIGIFCLLLIYTGSMIFPLESFSNYYGNFLSYKGLNGENWMIDSMPEKYDVVTYLRTHKNEKNLVEAVGDSYTDYNAISVFSGVPTVVGWRVHEWLWRGGYETVGKRDGEVNDFYTDNNIKKTKDFIEKYNVGWIVVGIDETEKYRVNHKKIKSLGKIVLEKENTYLVKVDY